MLLERDSYLADLSAELDAAGGGQGRVVLVSGEAGVGKTALVTRFAEHVGSEQVAWGACDPLFTPTPFGPLHDIARQTGGALDRMVRSGAGREHLFAAFLDFLETSPSPRVVVFEDVHWADEATLDLLRYVGRRIDGKGALLVVTFRDDEVGAHHPLRHVLGDLPAPRVRRLALSRLSRSAVEMLARRSGRSAEGLYAATSGNPFFVTEILASDEDGVPRSVRDAVLARSARLSHAARAVAEMVSVEPGRAERWLVDALVHPTTAAVDECVEIGILRLSGAALSFRHELARQAVEESLAPATRAALHKRAFDALQDRYAGAEEDPDVNVLARLVHHAHAAGLDEAVLRYGPRAARQAALAGSHREAASHYTRAVAVADGLAPARRAELMEAQSYECYLTQQVGAAVEARQAALDLRRTLGQPLEEGRNLRWMSRLLWFCGQPAEALGYAARGIEVLEALPPGPELAMAYSNRAQLAMLAEEIDETERWAGRAITLAEQFDDADTLAHALNNLGTALVLAQREEGLDPLQRSLSLALEHGFDEHAARAFTNLGTSSVRVRQLARGLEYLQRGIAFAAERDLDPWMGYMVAWRGRVHLERGDWAAAEEDARATLARSGVSPVERIPALVVLGRVLTRRGEGASHVLDEAQDLAQRTGELQRIGPVAAVRAEAAWLAGDAEGAVREAGPAYELALAHHDPWLRGELGMFLVQGGALEGLPEGVARPYALQAAGDWHAAADAWRGLGFPWERAVALAESGDVAAQRSALQIFKDLGAKVAAASLGRRLRARGVRGVPRGPRPSTRRNPHGLTNRQLDVLGWLAAGLTNAEIAERLFISPKTVDHHVSAILGKMGVRSRVQAAAEARRMGIDVSPK